MPPVFAFGQAIPSDFVFGQTSASTQGVSQSRPIRNDLFTAPVPTESSSDGGWELSIVDENVDLKALTIMPTTEEAQTMPELGEMSFRTGGGVSVETM